MLERAGNSDLNTRGLGVEFSMWAGPGGGARSLKTQSPNVGAWRMGPKMLVQDGRGSKYWGGGELRILEHLGLGLNYWSVGAGLNGEHLE